MNKLFVIVPCYNEENKIKDILGKIIGLKLDKDIIVVDDGSIDNTAQIVKENFRNIFLLKHRINLGKGAALKTGCEAAIKLGADTIVLMDADGQHQPEIIPKMIRQLREEKLDVVFGARKIDKKMPNLYYIGNIFLTKLINWVSGINIIDSQTGFKVFNSNIYDKILWQSADYFVETEMIINIGKNKLKYGHTFIETIYNDLYKGTTFFDGLKIFFNVLKQKIL